MAAKSTESHDIYWQRGVAGPEPSRKRLFLFPFAGGSARLFHGWAECFRRAGADAVELRALQLPGRDERHREPALKSMESVVAAVVDALRPSMDLPCAFFGYSLGGLIAFETARRLRSLGLPQPRRLIVAASPAPQYDHARSPLIHRLSHDDFIAELRRFKGTPEVVLQTPELLELLLPILRADFEVLETYQCRAEPPLAVPLTALGGLSDDEVSPESLADWSLQTSAGFQMQFFAGDHFFIKTHQSQLVELLARELQSV